MSLYNEITRGFENVIIPAMLEQNEGADSLAAWEVACDEAMREKRRTNFYPGWFDLETMQILVEAMRWLGDEDMTPECMCDITSDDQGYLVCRPLISVSLLGVTVDGVLLGFAVGETMNSRDTYSFYACFVDHRIFSQSRRSPRQFWESIPATQWKRIGYEYDIFVVTEREYFWAQQEETERCEIDIDWESFRRLYYGFDHDRLGGNGLEHQDVRDLPDRQELETYFKTREASMKLTGNNG